jgi:hypothetical protein
MKVRVLEAFGSGAGQVLEALDRAEDASLMPGGAAPGGAEPG